jgi:hypothetical protein
VDVLGSVRAAVMQRHQPTATRKRVSAGAVLPVSPL